MNWILMQIIAVVRLTVALRDEFTELIFRNQNLCGKPFSHAKWIPVLDQCNITCDQWEELCVEDDELQQQCNKLPKGCVRMIRHRAVQLGLLQVAEDAENFAEKPNRIRANGPLRYIRIGHSWRRIAPLSNYRNRWYGRTEWTG